MSEETLLTGVDDPPADPPESTWKWNDELPGAGDAPDWLKADKYESVAKQAQAYGELEKKFGSFTGAPDEYAVPAPETFTDLDLPEGLELSLDEKDPLLQAFMPIAKDMGINQDGFNKLVGLYIQQQAQDYVAGFTTADQQKEMLGEHADRRLASIASWGRGNLDDEMFGKLQESLTSAAAVEAVEAIIAKSRNAPLPNPGDLTPAPAFSKEDYEREFAKKDENGKWLYETDPAHRAKVRRMGEQVFGTEPHRQVMGS